MLTREQVKTFVDDLEVVAKDLAKKHGMDLQPFHATYTDEEIRSRLIWVVKGKAHERMARQNPFSPVKIGQIVTVLGEPGKTYKICGFSPRGIPIMERIPDGKRFRCPAERLVVQGEKTPAGLKNCTECPKCKKKTYKQVGSRRAGPELAVITFKCFSCGFTEQEPID
jgi:hypothetical protein